MTPFSEVCWAVDGQYFVIFKALLKGLQGPSERIFKALLKGLFWRDEAMGHCPLQSLPSLGANRTVAIAQWQQQELPPVQHQRDTAQAPATTTSVKFVDKEGNRQIL
ncbi:hypothetical protein HaLaN_02266 [Haematococcus lacustris]|uniref:Uncharacterized protein n=1 Tax=Haematococcus lacustris TaxID=44745 RepID=A0A699YKH4_HAELA|nr:hypothetical protein HaLaN_02266 [Haematococcus lacustris]